MASIEDVLDRLDADRQGALDRLFALFRRYGWIALALILILVGGTAWREYSQSRARAAADSSSPTPRSSSPAAP